MTKQILRKELSRVIQGSREIAEYEYYSLENLLSVEELQAICDIHGEDNEAAYNYGVAFNFDE